jgi:hypothetical protein
MHPPKLLENPYRPGAGHTPPFLAGRVNEQRFFKRHLLNNPITENVLITGLRGVGKTVLLEDTRQLAVKFNWLWVGNDLSESSTLNEERLALRILTDLSAAVLRKMADANAAEAGASLAKRLELVPILEVDSTPFAFEQLKQQYDAAGGLPLDRLKSVLQSAIALVHKAQMTGIVLAYDEAQCLSDRPDHDQFPMSMLVELICSLQRNQTSAAILLVLSGLPQVFDALTSSRTYTERMFHVMTLDRLDWDDTREALRKPFAPLMPPLFASDELLDKVAQMSGGYPYLIQFFGRELVDQILENGGTLATGDFPAPRTMDRLDSGLFAARWNRTSQRQREFLRLIALRPVSPASHFSAADILLVPNDAGFTLATAGQTLASLVERGLIYRTRHGRYAFTVPMSENMILRRYKHDETVEESWQPFSAAAPGHSSIETVAATATGISAVPGKKRRWFRA